MVCNRCKMAVRKELDQLGLIPITVELGEVELQKEMTATEKEKLGKKLIELGFELIDDRKSRIIEKVKNVIVNVVHHSQEQLKINLSDHLVQQLNLDYSYISNLFTEVEGTTIEQYFIANKVERVKELLVYDEHSLSEIAYQLNYSSVSHLSSQFKKVTGLTPSHFRQLRKIKRKPIDQL